ncbi:Tyrosine-protein kinase Btk29A [Lamellibrachia satsuma]|nr:Tyrosine-protein kinase Btk29A [Lamellibrachia satsuma]
MSLVLSRQLTHPNLVQLYGVCSAAPIYIVTEFMKHGALLQYLRRHKSTLLNQPGKLLDMCVQVCNAMKFLESHQFLHRDLAARNCLVGDNNVIKVGDFGLARFVLDDDYTSSSGTKFPIKWASPEVLQYTRFSSKSDVWAFGILMWEIFSGGDMPYRGIKNPDVIQQVVNRKKRLECPRDCPAAVYDVMMNCWKMMADHRPPFRDLYNELLKLQEEREYVG